MRRYYSAAFHNFIERILKMKVVGLAILILGTMLSCTTHKSLVSDSKIATVEKKDTIRIANDSLAYEITIIDSGFDSWLATAKPRSFYSLSYLENSNYRYVTEWNNRALQPFRYNSNLYEMQIDYRRDIHYGLEVNYLLFNYFQFFQSRYKQKL